MRSPHLARDEVKRLPQQPRMEGPHRLIIPVPYRITHRVGKSRRVMIGLVELKKLDRFERGVVVAQGLCVKKVLHND